MTVPKIVYEYVSLQLILRSVGIKTKEMQLSLTSNAKKTTNLSLFIKRGKLRAEFFIGAIDSNLVKTKKLWRVWQAMSSKEILNNFVSIKDQIEMFNEADSIVDRLVKHGFQLKDTAILDTI